MSTIFPIPFLFLFLFLLSSNPGFAQFSSPFSKPAALNTDAYFDDRGEYFSSVAMDDRGTCVAVWKREVIPDSEVFVARSNDYGATWTDPQPFEFPGENLVDYWGPHVATDGQGVWIIVWANSRIEGTDILYPDVLFVRSSDNGATWTSFTKLNSDPDTLPPGNDYPQVATDKNGTWIVTWSTNYGCPYPSSCPIAYVRSTDGGITWSSESYLSFGGHYDYASESSIATDGQGTWIITWRYHGWGGDADIACSRSTDNGVTWTDPTPLNDALSDANNEHDDLAFVSTDGSGTWVVAWRYILSEPPNSPQAIYSVRSSDNGLSWTSPVQLAPLSNAGWGWPNIANDSRGTWVVIFFGVIHVYSTDGAISWSDPDYLIKNVFAAADPYLTTDGLNWIVVFASDDSLDGEIGTDLDILVSRSILCDVLEAQLDRSVYGRRLFAPLCTRDAGDLPGGPGDDYVYDSTTVGINRGTNDRFFLSSSSTRFAPLAVDDAIHIQAQDSGFGPYSLQPGVPPFIIYAPIEMNLVPQAPEGSPPAPDPIPIGLNQVLFELLDTQREIYGNTAVYLVRDCGIHFEKAPDVTIKWVSHDVEIEGLQSNLDMVTGTISELWADRDFSRACFLGAFIDTTQATDTRSDPSAGQAYYYLVSGTCASPIGYGNASDGPRTGLPPGASCP